AADDAHASGRRGARGSPRGRWYHGAAFSALVPRRAPPSPGPFAMVSFFRRWKPDADKAKAARDDSASSEALRAAAEAIEAARAMGAAAEAEAEVQAPPKSKPLPPTDAARPAGEPGPEPE